MHVSSKVYTTNRSTTNFSTANRYTSIFLAMKQVGKKQCFEAREINGFERLLT